MRARVWHSPSMRVYLASTAPLLARLWEDRALTFSAGSPAVFVWSVDEDAAEDAADDGVDEGDGVTRARAQARTGDARAVTGGDVFLYGGAPP